MEKDLHIPQQTSNPRTPWDALSIQEKSEMMRTAIDNGILKLSDIKDKYNEFAKGGYVPSKEVKGRITNWEGAAMTGAKDPLSGKYLKNDTFEAEAERFTQALPESIRDKVLNNPELADHLYSYSYNVGAGAFKKRVVPALERYYSGKGSPQEITHSMWASGDGKLRGLRRRRDTEKAGVMNALTNEPMETPVSTFVYNPYQLSQANTTLYPTMVPDENSYVTAHQLTETERRKQKLQEHIEAIENFNNLMQLVGIQNNPLPSFVSTNPLLGLMGQSYAEGGSIHIKPENRGKFTKLKERTGHSATWFKEHGTPAQKKMATFALNARHWKHGLGGNLYDGESEPTQQMKIFSPYYDYSVAGHPLTRNIQFPEIVITPDSKKSPAERSILERERRVNQEKTTGKGTYDALRDRELTALQQIAAKREWENSVEKKALDYAQATTTGIGIGADIVSGLPIYSSLKGASVLSRAETPLDYVEGGLWLSPVLGNSYQAAKPMFKEAMENLLTEHPVLYQYPRYALGKFKYGFDAELPTLFRKVKNLPRVNNGLVEISNPNNRFAFDNGFGEESPLITNFTTDAPVRSHGAGNWDRGLTLAFPGKTLLGKKVISTRPSDTFIYGDNISIPTKEITGLTGRAKELEFLSNNGIETLTSPEAEFFWESGARDLAEKIAAARETNAKIFKNKGKGIVLLKPKTPIDNFDNYADQIETLAREHFKSPTLKDYQFMDYVFNPIYKSQVIPNEGHFTMGMLNENPALGEWIGSFERRRYFEQPWRWDNIIYDPLTTAESDFRNELNIGLKPEYKK